MARLASATTEDPAVLSTAKSQPRRAVRSQQKAAGANFFGRISQVSAGDVPTRLFDALQVLVDKGTISESQCDTVVPAL